MRHRQKLSGKIHFVLEEYMTLFHFHDIAEVDLDEFVEWARKNKKLAAPVVTESLLIRRLVTRALRDSFYEDPQQRLVRRYHHVAIDDPVTGERHDRVVDITTAPPKQMSLSFAVRREASLHDVIQLKNDLDSYNENNKYGATLEMEFNYDIDIVERKFPGEYPPNDDADDDDGKL